MGSTVTGVLTDLELWDHARDGDRESFGLLFDRHSRAIYNYCFRRTADWSLAEDLTSLVFLEAWRRRAQVRFIDGRVLPWLFGVATNLLRNQRRTMRRHEAALARLAPAEPERDFAGELIDRLADEQQLERLLEHLGRLPRWMQEVLMLCVWSELSYEDAAVALAVPVGTVRSRLSRTRARLRELDGGAGHEPGVTNPDYEAAT
jgi:RNA polymerase sigma-70 factor (ECF subfamily)